MRGLGLAALTCTCTLACSAPPGEVEPQTADGRGGALSERVENAAQVGAGAEAEPLAEPGSRAGPGEDPLLARARGRVRGGRVPEALRRELLASDEPDHRHAARLLQAIAGETPEAVLARAADHGGPVLALEPHATASKPGPSKPSPPEPEPEPEPELGPTLEEGEGGEEGEPGPVGREGPPSRVASPEHDRPDPPPKLSSLPIGSPAWRWFSSGLVIVEPEPEPAPASASADPIAGPLPLLLRERPSDPAAPPTAPGDGPRLVILTSLALEAEPERASLELAGAGSVEVFAQPLARDRVRLWMLDAGAVPKFLQARPASSGVTVVEVGRRGRRLEIEVELAPGWTLIGAETVDNGARVAFERRADE